MTDMFKSAMIFRINPDCDAPSSTTLEQALKAAQFTPCGPTQKESAGWVTPRDIEHSPFVENVGGQLLVKLQVERKSVPGSLIKKQLKERIKDIEAATGRKPGREEKRLLKEEIELELLPRAFPKTSAVLAWIDPKARFLVLGTTSSKAGDLVLSKLVDAFIEAGSQAAFSQIHTANSPSAAMSTWLTQHEPPHGFTIDRDLELVLPDSEVSSQVRYTSHNLDIDEVADHIKEGKVPTSVAMTWGGRVSFTLGADMTIKGVKLLDVVLDERQDGEDAFDADAAMVTGELSQLIPDLIEALGGEVDA